MLQQFRQYKYFYLPTLILIVIGLILLLFLQKGDGVLYFNDYPESFKRIFVYITRLGEFFGGAVIFIVLAIWGKRRDLFVFLLSAVLALLIAQSLKHYVFPDFNRPSFFIQLQDILDFERHKRYSFPSGHTTGAFAMFGALAFAFKKKQIHLLCGMLAVVIGMSRMILGQHFLEDIVTGMVLGTFIVSVVNIFATKRLHRLTWNKRLFGN